MEQKSNFAQTTIEKFQNKTITGVALFSRRGAEIFDTLALQHEVYPIDMFCLSQDVANGITGTTNKLYISKHPNAQSLKECIRNSINGNP
jgi:hypothetical protein